MLGESLIMLFQKTSTRTRISFEAGMTELGGHAICLVWNDSNLHLSKLSYEARCLGDNAAIIMARLKKYEDVCEVQHSVNIPVINGCCNRYHPCQGLADIYTIYEDIIYREKMTNSRKEVSLRDVHLAYIGVHNNVTNSLMEMALLFNVHLILVCPISPDGIVDKGVKEKLKQRGLLIESLDIQAAVQQVDYVYVDTWLDLEFFSRPEYAKIQQERVDKMMPYQLNAKLMQASQAKILHDMPIHTGYEISEEMVHSPQSLIFKQAANRKPVQKAVILYLLDKA